MPFSFAGKILVSFPQDYLYLVLSPFKFNLIFKANFYL